MPRVWTTAELRDEGLGHHALRRELELGSVQRVRVGVYARADLPADSVAAVAAGGRLGCGSALAHHGVWTLAPDAAVHVQLEPHARTFPSRVDLRRHWAALSDADSADRESVGVLDALIQAARCFEPRAFVAAVDSARHLGLLREHRLGDLRHALTADGRALLDLSDPSAESGIESIMRVRLLELGLRVRSQVWIGAAGRADLVVEDAVVVETDGDRWHDAKVTSRDRQRDAEFTRHGRTVLHFRYSQVVFQLDDCAATVLAALEVHRRVPSAGGRHPRLRRRLQALAATSERSAAAGGTGAGTA
ncbi:DUF559 domain-containing protein [Homoserinibacter sp. YIM 151385]|uniref:DUF559 domain-containing protein n=1 Tax=Homoserinibacter sp. YIM 151385 TaxID=2985506 RepID=UPI0022EFE991|nr:DUF559 domain-containing protein [Homoserinibacter sp. YIM 151385]WBU37612.1 DUF559 domain-containing protein [Homoserinibacter sp. YIM 151385]